MNNPQDWLSPSSPGGLYVARSECRVVVDLIHHALDGLTRHDVDVPGEEHAAASPLAHRLDEGVLDLREVARGHRLLVLDDLRGLDEEEGIESGEQVIVDDDGPVLVCFLRGLEPGRLGNSLIPGHATHGVQTLLLLVRHAVVDVFALSECAAANEHTDTAGIQRLAESVEHGLDDDVGEAAAGIVCHVDPFTVTRHLIDDRDRTVGIVIHIRINATILALHADAIRLTIGDEHQGRDLNVVSLHPIHHKLADDAHGLHGRSATKPQERSPIALVQDVILIQAGEQRFALLCGVP